MPAAVRKRDDPLAPPVGDRDPAPARQALELAESNEAAAHALVNTALGSVRESMKYYTPFAPIFNAALARVRGK